MRTSWRVLEERAFGCDVEPRVSMCVVGWWWNWRTPVSRHRGGTGVEASRPELRRDVRRRGRELEARVSHGKAFHWSGCALSD